MSAIIPASPCDREIEKDQTKTAFLIAGYARYKRPYVWLRSNHQKIAKISPDLSTSVENDAPVKLASVDKWISSEDIKLWEILSEIILLSHGALNIVTSNGNPFTLEH